MKQHYAVGLGDYDLWTLIVNPCAIGLAFLAGPWCDSVASR